MPARGGGAEKEAIGLAEGLPGAAGREAEASRDAGKWLQQSHGQPAMRQARDEETQDAFPQTPMLPSLEPLFPVTLTSFALNITLKIILRCSCVCPVLQDVASFAASLVLRASAYLLSRKPALTASYLQALGPVLLCHFTVCTLVPKLGWTSEPPCCTRNPGPSPRV